MQEEDKSLEKTFRTKGTRDSVIKALAILYLFGLFVSFLYSTAFCDGVRKSVEAGYYEHRSDAVSLAILFACGLGPIKYLLYVTPSATLLALFLFKVLPSEKNIIAIDNILKEKFNIAVDEKEMGKKWEKSELLNKSWRWKSDKHWGGDFNKRGNIIDFYNIYNRYLSKSVIIQKLDGNVVNFYLRNIKPNKKKYYENLSVKENLNNIFKKHPENVLENISENLLTHLLNYYREFLGISFEVNNGYFLILTNYNAIVSLDSQGKADLAIKKYENIFSKSVELKKIIEKHLSTSKIKV